MNKNQNQNNQNQRRDKNQENNQRKKNSFNNDQLGENMTEFSEDVNPNNVQRRRENERKKQQ